MHNYTLPQETNVAQAKSLLADSHYIDDDLLILDEINVNSISENALRMQCLFMALCTEGHARYCVDTKEQEVEAGDVMIVSEGQVLSNYMLSPDCRGVALMMSYDFYNDIINEIHELSALFLFSRMHPVFKLNKNEMHDMLSYFSAIRQKVSDTSHHFRREVVITLLKALIYDTSNVIYRIQTLEEKRPNRAESIFMAFIKLVEKNFRQKRRVGWYAKQLCITPKYLSETVKHISNRTPNDWIDKYVVMEIRVLLKSSNMSIKEISHELNFPNQSFLGKYFKEHVGMPPSQFRRS
ncbi:MAG: helix-turn-helix domain-containing protein [Prevotella sp.]|nr:helix-turn-helix domain-containing protein [Prevotella sp.]MDD7336912.1 helix-turn-helix domain-containing protein [Prevotella sp.]MDY4625793.1 helix-turn-helix domain-containing protein [Prevotella sp.]MDY4666959.1 helix-turn-helix domain-containing protein [Prevotella sp.]MDY5258861.1 helix-turn-helix domain-containing protein [Prevotella sp.]